MSEGDLIPGVHADEGLVPDLPSPETHLTPTVPREGGQSPDFGLPASSRLAETFSQKKIKSRFPPRKRSRSRSPRHSSSSKRRSRSRSPKSRRWDSLLYNYLRQWLPTVKKMWCYGREKWNPAVTKSESQGSWHQPPVLYHWATTTGQPPVIRV